MRTNRIDFEKKQGGGKGNKWGGQLSEEIFCYQHKINNNQLNDFQLIVLTVKQQIFLSQHKRWELASEKVRSWAAHYRCVLTKHPAVWDGNIYVI